jgi:hypothetical protein
MEPKPEPIVKPPPRSVRTIRDLILWEYAKVIAEAAGMAANYGFVMNRFKKLQAGEIEWRSADKDVVETLKEVRACVYCGATENLTTDHIIPLSKGGIDIPANTVLACSTCNSSKGGRDVFEWYFQVKQEVRVPHEVWKRYLKLVWDYHAMHRTLDRADLNMDGKLDLFDLAAVFRK